VWVLVGFYDGVYYTEYKARYVHTTGVISVKHLDGVYYAVGTASKVKDNGYTYGQLKMVVDLLTGAYVKVMINKHIFDASAYSCTGGASGATTGLVVQVDFMAVGNPQTALRIGNMIITQNEPG
jgi:hypothetical protein